MKKEIKQLETAINELHESNDITRSGRSTLNFAVRQLKNCNLQNVNRWAYLYDNWSPIMTGVAIGLSFMVIVTMLENVITKIALIIGG